MKIAVVGLGYVGLANAAALSMHHDVVGFDIDAEKISIISKGLCPFRDPELEQFLAAKNSKLAVTTELDVALDAVDLVVIATPTNFNETENTFDTRSVDQTIARAIAAKPKLGIVIRSTVPMGYTDAQNALHNNDQIFFAPEFLREGTAFKDTLEPSRIIVGGDADLSAKISKVLNSVCAVTDTPVLHMCATEAEAVKLFSNAYLAMRVAYFNELDSYALTNDLNAKDIIEGVGMDPRIGLHHNNPSFGYGGYCLPKDTKQLVSNFDVTPQSLLGSIVAANETRKQFIADYVIAQNPKTVGVYRLAMKTGADNFRESAVLDVMQVLKAGGVDVVLFEPDIENASYEGFRIERDFDAFKASCDVILANRLSKDLEPISDKVICRDIFGRD